MASDLDLTAYASQLRRWGLLALMTLYAQVDVDDLDGSFAQLLPVLDTVYRLQVAHAGDAVDTAMQVQADRAGRRYVADWRRGHADMPDWLPSRRREAADYQRLAPLGVKRLIGSGVPPTKAVQASLTRAGAVIGTAAHQVVRDLTLRRVTADNVGYRLSESWQAVEDDLVEAEAKVWRRWRRVPSAGACQFCLTVASRGAIYSTPQSAGEGNRYHSGCSCGVSMEVDPALAPQMHVKDDGHQMPDRFSITPAPGTRQYTYRTSQFDVRRVPPPKPGWEVPEPGPSRPKKNPAAQAPAEEPAHKDPAKVTDLPKATITPQEAVEGANPGFATGEDDWTYNCTRAVIAYELRRRGYDVTAGPAARTTDGKVVGDRGPRVTGESFEAGDSGWVTPEGGHLASVGTEFPDSARLFVFWGWKGRNSGHIVAAERREGKTVFIDPQTGREHDADHYAGRVTGVHYRRVDDAVERDGATQFIRWNKEDAHAEH